MLGLWTKDTINRIATCLKSTEQLTSIKLEIYFQSAGPTFWTSTLRLSSYMNQARVILTFSRKENNTYSMRRVERLTSSCVHLTFTFPQSFASATSESVSWHMASSPSSLWRFNTWLKYTNSAPIDSHHCNRVGLITKCLSMADSFRP